MNKFFFAILLLVTTLLFAQENQGVRVSVELVNGTRQNAMFLGIQQDTVNLGGIIQGKFTIVKIKKNRFKSIVDEQGNDLLNPPPQPPKDSTTTVPTDTIVASRDTNSAGSVTTDTSSAKTESPNDSYHFLASTEDKHIFVALERRSIDSVLAEQLNALIVRLLQEKGTPIVLAKRTDFGYCREQGCIRDSLAHYGAASVFQGSITAAKAQDSLIISINHTSFSKEVSQQDSSIQKDSVHSAQMTLSTFTALNDAIAKNRLIKFLNKLQGIKVEPERKKKGYIHVETNPDGATLEMDGGNSICKTPCTFATADTGKIILYAHWSVDKHIWAARSSVPIIPGDTNKISMKLKKSKPELLITSIPENAEIYAGSAPLTKETKAIGHTPSKFTIYEPGLSTVQLRKEGFRDTLVTVYASPTELTSLEIAMEPISDLEELLNQQEWIKTKKKIFVGKTLMGTAVVPVLLGALFTYLAHVDYDDAEEIKNDLSRSASANGENYQKMVKKNHRLVDNGDEKMVIGGSLLGAGAILFAVGFTLSF